MNYYICKKNIKCNTILTSVLFFFISFVFTLFTPYNAFASNGMPKGIFGDWYVFKTVKDKEKLLCYMMSLPLKRYDNFNKRGQSFFSIIVEHDKNNGELFLSFGQIWKKGVKSAELDIAKRKFPILTYDDKGWAYNKIDDENIIKELQRSAIFTISVDFNGNKSLIDIYSLNGFNEAYQEIINNCN